MNILPFIPKDDHRLPDAYGITVNYIDGKSEQFEIASHRYNKDIFEFVTHDDVWHWIVPSALKRVEFDKRFSKMVAIKAELAKNAKDGAQLAGQLIKP